jgi:energy-coupling factor transporter ATP-binding protein EcfA2
MVWRIIAVVATTVGAYIYKEEISESASDLWDSFIILLKGKKIAILGARGSGKTTLLTFLSKGELPAESKQTTMAFPVSARRFALKDLQLDLKETQDVPGGEWALDEWKKLHDESDYVIYLINAAELDKSGTGIDYDLKKIKGWRSVEKCKSKFLIVATHMDKDSAYMALQPHNRGNFHDRFVRDLGRYMAPFEIPPRVILGSLDNQKNTENLVVDIIKWMKNEDKNA